MNRVLSAILLVLTACGAQPRPDDALTAPEQHILADNAVNPAILHCNTLRTWNPTLRAEAKASAQVMLADLAKLGLAVPQEKTDDARRALTDVLTWRMVRATIVDGNQNNLGVVAVRDVRTQDGRPLLLFRSGFTPAPARADSCVQSLLAAGVMHGVNLYQGPMPTEDLAQAEKKQYCDAGGTYFNVQDDPELASWRDELRDDPASAQKAQLAIARVIREGILQPGGHAPQGHVQIHCGGGMHRTGMVVGVLERCWNGAPQDVWERAYRRHVAWQSDAQPGGFEAANLAFIAHFDCGLLQKNR
jgi:hypothetical protein